MHFKKSIFDIFCRINGLTSDAIFSIIWPCRNVFNTILENYKEKSFQKWFWNLSHIFGRGKKMHFKKTIFYVICPFLGLTLTYNCSVICQGRMLIFSLKFCSYISCGTIFFTPQGDKCSKTLFKKSPFCNFFALFRPHFKCNYLSHLLILWGGGGPKGPPMPSTGARRKGP